MDHETFQAKVAELADKHGVPGVAAGLLVGGEEHYGYAGVTSVENPLPVDENTFFQFGSTGKTFTATAIMVLAEQGRLRLDAPVRDYVPALRLKDEDVAGRVTVLQLLNHTAGWDGDVLDDTGDGEDFLDRYVELLATKDQVTPLGATVSYNNAALNVAGKVIENVTGLPYEKAMVELVLKPLGLAQTYYTQAQVVTRRFVVGHELDKDDQPRVARPLFMPRSSAPGRQHRHGHRRVTRSSGRSSTSATVRRCSAPSRSSGCRSRACRSRPARWVTRSASRGSCASSAASSPWLTAAPPTASTRRSSWCRSTTSR